MIRATALAILLVAPAYASEGNRNVRLLSADQVGSCTKLGTVQEIRSSGRDPDGAEQKALSTAMDKAAKAQANAAVIANASSDGKHQTVVLQTYHCGDAVGFSSAN